MIRSEADPIEPVHFSCDGAPEPPETGREGGLELRSDRCVGFASDAGYDEKAALKAATCFRGGMQMGSVCGAVTGGLLALGLAGIEDREAVDEYIRKIREARGGIIDCRDIVSEAAQKGIAKKRYCDAMICECVGYAEEILKENGRI